MAVEAVWLVRGLLGSALREGKLEQEPSQGVASGKKQTKARKEKLGQRPLSEALDDAGSKRDRLGVCF